MSCLFFKSPQHNIELWHSHQGNRGCFNKCRIALFQIMLACTGSSRRKNERARKGRGSLSPSCVHVLSCAHYFQEQAMIMQVRDSLETKKLCCYHIKVWTAHENSQHFTTPPLVLKKFPEKWHLRNECRNFILMTSHYPDLDSASDWLCCMTNLLQPIRRTTHIWVVKCHQYQILAVVS